jgi:hypothetical protein
MLSVACRRFRARFSPGPGPVHPHRRSCPECEAFAAALESAAGARLPLPAGLQRSLRAVAGPEPGAVLPFAVPRLPVPGALAARLRGIAKIATPERPAPPEWVRSPRYAVAASALLALLLGPFLSDAAHRGIKVLGVVQEHIQEHVSPLLHKTEAGGREEIGKLRSTAASAYDEARQSVETYLGHLDHGFSGLSARLSGITPRFINQDPAARPAGSVRRPQ